MPVPKGSLASPETASDGIQDIAVISPSIRMIAWSRCVMSQNRVQPCVRQCGWHHRRQCRCSVPLRIVNVRNAVDAVVVGAGPNGLTAAARLAIAGRRVMVFEGASTIGGGSRTKALTDVAVYDVCAAVHPFGASSPAFAELALPERGVQWLHPPAALAHPFDDGG